MRAAHDSRLACQAFVALLLANARYWSTVTPLVRKQLRHWERRAQAIPDPELRALALSKLGQESFNAEAAAVAATLAPRVHRPHAVEAIVALELMFDYLDGLTERPLEDPLLDGERLYGALLSAIDPHAELSEEVEHAYLHELASCVRAALVQLPAHEAIVDVARRCAGRSAQAQIRMHAASTIGTAQLGAWARNQAGESGLAWREYLAGAASSVLSLHALIAAAAHPGMTGREAERLDDVYLSIAAVVTLLDGLIDHEQDAQMGELSYAGLYEEPGLLAGAIGRAVLHASSGSLELPGGAHHAMTLASAVAYWASAPGARNDFARPVLAHLRSELRMLVLPPLLVMRTWRACKEMRRRWRAVAARRGIMSLC